MDQLVFLAAVVVVLIVGQTCYYLFIKFKAEYKDRILKIEEAEERAEARGYYLGMGAHVEANLEISEQVKVCDSKGAVLEEKRKASRV